MKNTTKILIGTIAILLCNTLFNLYANSNINHIYNRIGELEQINSQQYKVNKDLQKQIYNLKIQIENN